MSIETDKPQIEQKLVVTFDICSSTAIIEDLHKSDEAVRWRDFLIWMKNYLRTKSEEIGFYIYKFTGDGWILLFDPVCPGDVLLRFLREFCVQFRREYKKRIEGRLDTPPHTSGMTFGIASGSLVGFTMNGQLEYVGRAINLACRLQGAIKDKDKSPQYKALIAKPVYQIIRKSLSAFKTTEVSRVMRNIAGNKKVRCVKVWLS